MDFHGHGPIIILIMHLYAQVMLVLPPEHTEPVFVDFEGHAKLVEAADAHVIALHEVIHHVFKSGFHRCAI